ncbi:MAG: MFS transporter [Pseudomonadota bacterium]
MSDLASDLPDVPPQGEDGPAKRAVALLVWAQSVLGAQLPVHFILGGLVGQMLAETPALATLPISMIVIASMVAAPILSQLMGRYGRRTGFFIGAGFGALSGLVAVEAILARDFALFCGATALSGVYLAAHNLYRFAAADLASDAFRPRAISYVMAGGLMAAILGPEIVRQFGEAMEPVPHAGAYRALVILNILGALPLLLLRIPRPPQPERGAPRAGRPWGEILRERRLVVAMLCAMVSYALMNLVMTSTPLAMVLCGFGTGDAAEVVRAHVLAMYAPSFFTGALIARFGAPRIIATGLALLAIAALIGAHGIALGNFFGALILLGIGWNFGFVGATAMLAEALRPEERARVQGMNDFLVMALVSVASLSSGVLLAEAGWEVVLLATAPFLALAGGALVWLLLREGLQPSRG